MFVEKVERLPVSNFYTHLTPHTTQPNTKRRFADDDPSDDEDDDYTEQPVYRGGGKQLSMGKQFQARHVMQEDSDEDDDSEEDDVVPMRGAGKQFRPSGGKQLRVM